jgi:hypothetical protein
MSIYVLARQRQRPQSDIVTQYRSGSKHGIFCGDRCELVFCPRDGHDAVQMTIDQIVRLRLRTRKCESDKSNSSFQANADHGVSPFVSPCDLNMP